MATKTISIDMEAYRRLQRVKRKDESFSQVIKRKVRPPLDLDVWLKKLQKIEMDTGFVAGVEHQLVQRHRPSGRAR